MASIFDPDAIFRLDHDTAVAQAVHDNTEAAADFENRKAAWLQTSAVDKAIGKALGVKPVPLPVKKISVDFAARTYTTSWGPELVGDPNFYLPPDPPEPAGGVAVVGALWFPGVYQVGPGDTYQHGQKTTHDGKTLQKRINAVPPSQWYQVVE